MKTLVWSATFVRAFKRSTRRDPALKERAADTLRQLAEDPFHPTLHSHKLKGELSGVWRAVPGSVAAHRVEGLVDYFE